MPIDKSSTHEARSSLTVPKNAVQLGEQVIERAIVLYYAIRMGGRREAALLC